MEAFGMFLVKSAVWLTGFTLIYLVFLRNERYFGLNRAFLLSGIFASILFPLFTWHYAVVLPPLPVEEISAVPEVTEEVTYIAPAAPKVPFYWWIYILGIVCLALRLILQTVQVVKRLRKSGYEKNGSIKLVRTPEYSASFSFFSFVFVNPSTSDIEAQEIVNHESGHIQNRHWFDLLLMELLRILQWFNPFAWIYAHLVRQNHEYLADEIALRRSSNPAIYQAALLNQVFGVPVISLANSFSNSLNKKRFTMMKKKIYSPFRKLKLLMVLPLMAIVFYAFARPEYVESTPTTTENVSSVAKEGKVKGTVTNEKGNPLEGAAVVIKGTTMGTTTDANGDFVLKNVPPDAELVISYVGFKTEKLNPDFDHRMKIQMGVSTVGIGKISVNAEETSSKNLGEVQVIGYGVTKKGEPNISKPDKSSFSVVEQMPEFPGGQIEMMKYLHQNIKYPTQAKGEKIEGTVVVKFTVNKAGKIKDAKVARGVHKELDAEALRVISSMPEWNPGTQNGKPVDVEFTIPVEFALKSTYNQRTPIQRYMLRGVGPIHFRSDDQKEPPLIILDGKIITNAEMEKLNPHSIESISVLKDESATKAYGEKAKNGVIVLSSKEKSESGAVVQPKKGDLIVQGYAAYRSSQEFYFYKEIDEKPQFPGGKTEMMRFLARNMKYPVIASEKGAEGTALVRFTVTQTGQINNVGVINDIDPSLKSEAVRSIMKMPVWDPGKKNGKAVNVVCTIPFKYIIESGIKRSPGDARTLPGDFDEVVIVTLGRSEPTATEDKPFVNVEEMPEFPGGQKELMKFIQGNLKYPVEAQTQRIQGTVVIQFVVMSTGKLDHYKIVRGVNSLLDDEALRVLKLSPDWIPGKQGGKAVNVYYTLPFRYVLSASSTAATPPPPPPVPSDNN